MLQKSYRSKVHIGRSGNSAIHGALQSESKGSFGRLPRATRQGRLKTRTVYSASLRLARESPAGKIEQEEATAETPTEKADGTPLGEGVGNPRRTQAPARPNPPPKQMQPTQHVRSLRAPGALPPTVTNAARHRPDLPRARTPALPCY